MLGALGLTIVNKRMQMLTCEGQYSTPQVNTSNHKHTIKTIATTI
jgi:hypothetical protein